MASTTGKYAIIRIDATGSGALPGTPLYGVQNWTVSLQSDRLDSTDSESGGIEEIDAGVTGISVSVSGVHKLTQGPFPDFEPGAFAEDCAFYLNSTDTSSKHTFTKLVVLSCRSSAEIRGQIRYEIEMANAVGGTWTTSTS